jgi:uncharacterized membrane-anchored protein
MNSSAAASPLARQMLNKVPEVTIFFWIIKLMATTVGETAADFLNDTLGFGLSKTSVVMSVLLIAALAYQFTRGRYIPPVYWLAVVLISVVGTLITDNLTDGLGVPLLYSTIAFSIALIAAFATWWGVERSLSIHSIVTRRRESFYWLAILFTFALGTAAGDYLAETLSIGYARSALMFGAMIAVIAGIHYAIRAVLSSEHKRQSSNAVLAFWLCYILTRPLGASLGDLLTQPKADGGLGLGTTVVTAVFVSSIIAMIAYLTISKVDVIERATPEGEAHAQTLGPVAMGSRSA